MILIFTGKIQVNKYSFIIIHNILEIYIIKTNI